MAEYKFGWMDYAFWALMIFILIMLAWRIFGHSPGMEGFIIALIGSEAMLWRYMYKHGRELERTRFEISNINSKLEKLDSIDKKLEELRKP